MCTETSNDSFLLPGVYSLTYRHLLARPASSCPCALHNKHGRVLGSPLFGASPSEWAWPSQPQLPRMSALSSFSEASVRFAGPSHAGHCTYEAERVRCGESHVSHGREVLASSRRMAQIDNKGRHLEHIPHESQRRQRARTPSGLEWQDEPMPKYTPHPFLGFSVPSPAEMTQSRTK